MVEHDRSPLSGFEHEALLYDGLPGLLDGVVPFVEAGVAAGEPVLVALPTEHLGPVRHALGNDATRVEWLDLRGLGANPSRIIPAWAAFVERHQDSGLPLRGVGEPIWANRSPDELVECQLHEELLNVAFDDGPPWTLLCPYDVEALAPQVLDGACRSHPWVSDGEERSRSTHHHPLPGGVPGGPLTGGPDTAMTIDVTAENLVAARELAHELGDGWLSPARAVDYATAVHEIAANSVRHGGGRGTLRAWTTERSVVVQVDDDGWITDPLAGRRRPALDTPSGRGLWMANQLCDLVQLRSSPGGTTVRLHQHRA